MELKKREGSGTAGFMVACLIYIGGYYALEGKMPGVQGSLHWWSFLVVLLIWACLDTAVGMMRGAR